MYPLKECSTEKILECSDRRSMLLTFDIGNTNIVVGAYKGENLIANWRIQTNSRRSADETGTIVYQFLQNQGIQKSEISDIVISSVVPQIMYTMIHMAQKYFEIEPMIIGPGTKTGIHVKYENPKQVGADRIVNAVAGIKKYGSPLIIVDFGTATTFCAISSKSEYLGGSILPGIQISAEALYDKAAKLTRVELAKMEKVICTNTSQSMQSGIYFGYIGSVDKIVTKMKDELVKYGEKEEIKVVATGGLATLISEGSNMIDVVDRNLTLDGLNILYHLNANKARAAKRSIEDFEE